MQLRQHQMDQARGSDTQKRAKVTSERGKESGEIVSGSESVDICL